jgi:hypothetical protein
MTVARSPVGVLLVLAIAGCTADGAPTVPRDVENMRPVLNSGQGVVAHASGGGIVNFSTAGVGNGHFNFTATVKGDGSVVGSFRQRREQAGLVIDFSGIVTCLTVNSELHRARIGGVITENNSTHPNFLTENHQVGDDVWFRVQEGGEGKDAVDASTTYGFKPTLVNTSAEYCALPFTGFVPGTTTLAWNPASTFPLLSGNIQVRP